MKWVVIIKFADGARRLITFDTFDEAINELYTWNYDAPFMGRNPIKVTIEKMVIIESE